MAQIQWFPGHMAKAKREIADKIKLIDIVVELVDARAPYSSKNPLFNSVVNNKPRLIVMTKEDLADDKLTQKWIDFYKSKGYYAISVNLKQFNEYKKIIQVCKEILKDKMAREAKKGLKPRAMRAMVLGIPNVGKSTLISVVSQAKPVIADYHFTTITPVLGVVRMHEDSSFVIADIPGLIEGAGEGLGLGHQFLRHVERCRLLVHVVDVSGSEGRSPTKDFEIINRELKKFNEDLAEKPMIVAGNKCDLATDEQVEKFRNYVEAKGYKFFPIMAPIKHGVDVLMQYIEAQLAKLPPITIYEVEQLPKDLFEKNSDVIDVKNQDGTYFVTGDKVLRLVQSVNFDDYESLQYFQKMLGTLGVSEALQNAGIKEGDTVNIYDFEFEFVE